MHTQRLVLASLISLSILAITPNVEAQDASDWTVEVISSTGQVPTEISTDNNGEVVGLMFKGTANGNQFFLRRDTADGSFAIINSDITGATAARGLHLIHATGTTWVA